MSISSASSLLEVQTARRWVIHNYGRPADRFIIWKKKVESKLKTRRNTSGSFIVVSSTNTIIPHHRGIGTDHFITLRI